MVGKKSGRALLRDEGMPAYCHCFDFACLGTKRSSSLTALHSCPPHGLLIACLQSTNADCDHRPAAHGQWHGPHQLASGEYDQSEKLLHVCCLDFTSSLCAKLHSAITRPSQCIIVTNMVGRKTLDVLRKGTKDLYALNTQYCRRSESVPCTLINHNIPTKRDRADY